jgi:peptidoglycan-associated lipoprotein
MRHLRALLFSFMAVTVIFAGYGCANKQLKSDGGQIKSSSPSEAVQKAPSEDTDKSKRDAKETEAPPGQKEQPEPVDAARNEKSLQAIYFDLDKYDIKPDDTRILEEGAKWIRAKKPGLVVIEGNCDERGTVEYNLALGERRSEAAKDYLVSLGVDANKLKTISYGKSKPVDTSHNEEAWAKNRRDSFVVQ